MGAFTFRVGVWKNLVSKYQIHLPFPLPTPNNTHTHTLTSAQSISPMAPPPATSIQSTKRRSVGFFANAFKQKDKCFQFIAMTGILLLSMKSLSKKYRLHDLQEDTYNLREEKESLTERMNKIKQSLLDEAARDSTGAFAARLKLLFGSNED